jgi:hypothetical protein
MTPSGPWNGTAIDGVAPHLGSPCFPLLPAAPAQNIRTPDMDQVRT